MRKTIFLLLFTILSVGIANAQQNDLSIIPKPISTQTYEGNFRLTNLTCIVSLDVETYDEQYLIFEIKKRYNIKLIHGASYNLNKPSVIRVTNDTSRNKKNGAYTLLVSNGIISISGSGKDGIFNGMQSLLQIIKKESDTSLLVPKCLIIDEPRFDWRGMHLDVSRHFFTKEEVKKIIDLLAFHKMNIFHWHLTDDQGWRIEIKKYPLLTSIGSKRKETMIDKNFDPYIGDGKSYGGFYTQKDIQEIVSYADNRHITIVPEIEMPGHAQAAISAYPQYCCSGLPSDVLTKWGVSENVFCTKDSTLQFVKDILQEVMQMFPSQYIHIGGDEVPKTAWKKCGNCQRNIQKFNLKDEHELQSWFIKQIDEFVTANGKQIIGWDEILEGGLAPNAAVMSWRGTEGGIEAAKMKHKVVMCPGSHCYFDHYQGSPLTQPIAIGGFTTIQKVYSYEPIPEALNEAEQQFILGAQANLWTEYIADYNKLTFMALPRMSALAEVLWTKKELRDYADFQSRLLHQLKIWDKQSIKYSKAMMDIETSIQPDSNHQAIKVMLKAPFADGIIKYKMCDTCSLKNYSTSLVVNKSTTVQAYYEKNAMDIKSETWKQKFITHKAFAKNITLSKNADNRYNYGGAFTLVDGIRGITPWYSKEWLGFSGIDCEAMIDLGEEKPVSRVKIGLLHDEASWIHLPDSIEVMYSLDGISYAPFFTQPLYISETNKKKQRQEQTFIPAIPQNNIFLNETNYSKIKPTGITARYIKTKIYCNKKIPDNKAGAGEKAWLFIDEIEVK